MQETAEKLRAAERAMMIAIHRAIDAAGEQAQEEIAALGVAKPADVYFTEAALFGLFLHRCGANPVTSEGGDPDRAWSIAYVARRLAYAWDHETPSGRRRKKDSAMDLAKDASERAEINRQAERLAIRETLHVLIKTISISDPDLRARIREAVEARVGAFEADSQSGQQFAQRARESVAGLLAEK